MLHTAAGNLYGGVETILLTLARHRALCPQMLPEFALCFDARLANELRAESVPVHMLGDVKFSRPWSLYSARKNFRRLLTERHIDVVVCHSAWPHAVFARSAKKLSRPVVFWLHTRVEGKHWTERLAAKTPPDLAIAVSRDSGESMQLAFPGLPYEVLYTPMPRASVELSPTERQQLRAEFGANDNTVVITQASRMESWKGHRILLEALAKLRDDPHWQAWVIGGAQRPAEQKYFDELRALASRLGLIERIKFLGQRADVQRLLCATDIYCQPNLGPEGFSIVFIEACLARLPIVTSALGGALEIVDEQIGVLTVPGALDAVAAALRRLCADPAERKRMGNAAFKRVHELCDPQTQLQKMHTLFERLRSRKA